MSVGGWRAGPGRWRVWAEDEEGPITDSCVIDAGLDAEGRLVPKDPIEVTATRSPVGRTQWHGLCLLGEDVGKKAIGPAQGVMA